MSEGGGGKKKAAGPPFRRGKWTTEEENYALRLITEFKGGLLPLQDGTTLRTFLSKLLNCDPMRISKKFVGGNCIGKQVFKRRQQDIDRLTPEDLERTRLEISDLEKRFLEKTAQLNRAQQDPAALLSGGGPKLGRLGGVLSPEDCILPPWMMPPSQQDAAQGGAKPPQSLKTSSRLSNRAAMLNDASHFGTFGDAHVAFEDVPQTFSDWTYYSAAAGAEGEDEGGVDLTSAPPHNQGDVYFGNHDQETINSKKKTRNNKDERDERNLSTGLLSYNSLDGSSSSSSSAAALNSSYLGRISLTDMSSSTSLYSGVDSSNSSSSNSGGSSSSSSAGSVVGEDDDAVTDTSSISMRVRSVPATHSVVGRPPADSIVSNSSAVTTASNTTAPGDPGGGGGNMNKGLIRNSSVDNFWCVFLSSRFSSLSAPSDPLYSPSLRAGSSSTLAISPSRTKTHSPKASYRQTQHQHQQRQLQQRWRHQPCLWQQQQLQQRRRFRPAREG